MYVVYALHTKLFCQKETNMRPKFWGPSGSRFQAIRGATWNDDKVFTHFPCLYLFHGKKAMFFFFFVRLIGAQCLRSSQLVFLDIRTEPSSWQLRLLVLVRICELYRGNVVVRQSTASDVVPSQLQYCGAAGKCHFFSCTYEWNLDCKLL